MITKGLSSQQTLNKWFFFNKITGQKRKTGISCHVFSFQQSLSFVERFVEKMLSLKYLIFNTFFIIFNNSTKLYAI